MSEVLSESMRVSELLNSLIEENRVLKRERDKAIEESKNDHKNYCDTEHRYNTANYRLEKIQKELRAIFKTAFGEGHYGDDSSMLGVVHRHMKWNKESIPTPSELRVVRAQARRIRIFAEVERVSDALKSSDFTGKVRHIPEELAEEIADVFREKGWKVNIYESGGEGEGYVKLAFEDPHQNNSQDIGFIKEGLVEK